MSAEMDPKVAKLLDEMCADVAKRREERLEEKWPEYRETGSATVRDEFKVQYMRRAALRWAKVWMPPGADRELRAAEDLLMDFLERHGDDGGDPEAHHRTLTQGLVHLGNAMAKVLRASQGGNQAARLAALADIADAVAAGTSTAEVLRAADEYHPELPKAENDANDVRD